MKAEIEAPSELTLESYMSNNKPNRRTSVLVAHINEIGIMRLANFTQAQIAEYLSVKLGKKVSQGAISLALSGKIGSKRNLDVELTVIERLRETNDRKDRLLLAMKALADPAKSTEAPMLPAAAASSHSPAAGGWRPIAPNESVIQASTTTKPKMTKEEVSRTLDEFIKAEANRLPDYIPRKSALTEPAQEIMET